jgi:hypothetical protein
VRRCGTHLWRRDFSYSHRCMYHTGFSIGWHCVSRERLAV